MRLIPATDAAPHQPASGKMDGLWRSLVGPADERSHSQLWHTLALCAGLSQRSKRETSLGHDGEWRVRFAPACGQPSPTFFPPCLVWSYHVSCNGPTLGAIEPIRVGSLRRRRFLKHRDSWFLVLRVEGPLTFRAGSLGVTRCHIDSHSQLTCAILPILTTVNGKLT